MTPSTQFVDGVCTLGRFYRRLCSRYADRPAIETPERTLTYADVERQSAKLASAFRSMGLQSEDRVAIMMQNHPEFIVTEIAAARAGVVVVPLNYKLDDSDLERAIQRANVRTIVVGPEFFDTVDHIRQSGSQLHHIIGLDRDCETPIGFNDYSELLRKAKPTPPETTAEPDDPAIIYFTGGTTGEQKGTVHTHDALVLNVYAHIHELELYRDEELLLVTPLAHSANIFFKTGLAQGATIHLRQGFTPSDTVSTIERESISWTYLIPAMISTLLNTDGIDAADLSSLETVVYGSAPIPPSQLERGLDLIGDVFIQFYGLVEVPNLTTVLPRRYHDPDAEKWLRSTGITAQLSEVTILDLADAQVDDRDNVGEVGIRAPYQMRGYLDENLETDGDWIHTGDIGRIDERGRLFLLDRLQDVIVRDGMPVYSLEVENVIQRYPHVEQVAVIGVPADDTVPDIATSDRHQTEQSVKAVVVTTDRESITLEDLQAHCREFLAERKVPDSLDTVGQLPETPYGKTDKKSLRDPYW